MEIRNQTNSIMKRIVTLFLCMLLLTSIHAQETELTIDNQTPGWLSSKLTYAEQVALKKLTLTGYVNHEDIVFVNKLISNYNLEWLDISDINVLEYGENDYYGFIRCGDKTLKRLILPKNWNFSGYPVSGKVDTLTVLYKPNQKITAKYIDLLEGPEHIIGETISVLNNGKIFTLPQSLKIIENRAISYNTNSNFCITEPFVFPNNIVRIGSEKNNWEGGGTWISQNGVTFKFPISTKRFDFPDSLEIYNSSRWGVMTDYSTHYQIYSSHIYESDTISVGAKCKIMYAQLKANVAIFYSKTPPSQYRGDSKNAGDFSFGILYVPEGCSSAYKSAYQNKGNKIDEIREMKSISSISITPSSSSLYVGETEVLKASIYPSNAFDKTFYWQSSNDSIATVDKNGKVTAVNTGVVTINAVSKDGNTLGSCEITVLQHATGVSLVQSEIELNKIGESYQLEAIVQPDNASNKKVNWITSNLGICHIGNDGKVTATGFGTAVVFATTDDGGYTASCIVHVIDTSSASYIETTEDNIYISDGKIMFSDIFANKGVSIYSITGKLMYNGKAKSLELPSGIYIIKLDCKIIKIKI